MPDPVRATPVHAEALAATHALAFDSPWTAAAFADLLAGPDVFGFLAGADGPPGVILCRVAAGEMEVLTLGVAPEARRCGVGRRLMTAALETGAQAGATEAFLEVAVDNGAAIALYNRMGFRRSGLRKAYYARDGGPSVDALVMHLDLARAGA